MEQETMAAQTIETVGTDVLYDESVKRLLANKSILAVILKECMPEFKRRRLAKWASPPMKPTAAGKSFTV